MLRYAHAWGARAEGAASRKREAQVCRSPKDWRDWLEAGRLDVDPRLSPSATRMLGFALV